MVEVVVFPLAGFVRVFDAPPDPLAEGNKSAPAIFKAARDCSIV